MLKTIKDKSVTGLLLLLPILACNPQKQELDKNTRQLIESMAKSRMVSRDSIIKAQCDSIYNYWYDRYVDSIYAIRKAEMKSIRRERIQ